METQLKALIADDEPLARRRLRRLLAEEPGIEVIGECSSAAEARALLESENPDVLFLDVHMPGEDGLELARTLPREGRPAVIFVTAFDQYAVQAFEVHALDYLLKPTSTERLREALGRAREQLRRPHADDLDRRLRALIEDLSVSKRGFDRIPVRNPGRISFVNSADVHWIEAEGNYVRLHLARERHLVRQKIGTLEKRLDPRRFLRIHRSAIVNLERVKELQRLPGGDYAVLLDSGTRLTMSRSHKERFEAAVGRGIDDVD